MAWKLELTDTFGGEANYCWVERATLDAIESESALAKVRRFKRALGLSGQRGRGYLTGDFWEFRPYGRCVVAFATWDDWSD
jgi:hypothetical protein